MKRMITRTITFATVEGMTANMETMIMEKKRFNFSGNLTKYDDIIENVKAENETESLKILSVDMETITKEDIIYGMDENDFIRYAVKMESRTKKAEEKTEDKAE